MAVRTLPTIGRKWRIPCFHDAAFCRPAPLPPAQAWPHFTPSLRAEETSSSAAAVHRRSEVHEGPGQANHRRRKTARQEKARQLMTGQPSRRPPSDGRDFARTISPACNGGEANGCLPWCCRPRVAPFVYARHLKKAGRANNWRNSPEGKNADVRTWQEDQNPYQTTGARDSRTRTFRPARWVWKRLCASFSANGIAKARLK